MLAQGSDVGVIVHGGGHSQTLLQPLPKRYLLPAGYVVRQEHQALGRVYQPPETDPHSGQRGFDCSQQVLCQPHHDLQVALDVAAGR
jgi:hypothetical protein